MLTLLRADTHQNRTDLIQGVGSKGTHFENQVTFLSFLNLREKLTISNTLVSYASYTFLP